MIAKGFGSGGNIVAKGFGSRIETIKKLLSGSIVYMTRAVNNIYFFRHRK